ncbi:MAG TPA: helix-turn-helix transcriptional regulator, partial [Candidatus Binataceae bacterium]|nr:helix-turn-helix transcriptional regulator [Candidatus Binataceae bacterium]
PREHKVVGQVLSDIRKRAGVTQQELAQRLNKPQSFVSAYENGQRRIDLLEFMRITEALRVDPRKAFGEVLAEKS